jgi:hypothetical protein
MRIQLNPHPFSIHEAFEQGRTFYQTTKLMARPQKASKNIKKREHV